MKLAILSESSADDAAIKILIDAIIGEETELVSPHHRYDFKTRGWPQALQLLPSFFAYWYGTDAEAVVIIVDSDDSPIYQTEHEEENRANKECRYCLLRQKVEEVHSRLTLPDGRERMRVAVGIAVPAIEAWLCCLQNSRVNESVWGRRHTENILFDRKSLKKDVYGSDRASRQMIEDGSTRAVQTLIADIEEVKKRFPQGFGKLVEEIQSW